MKKINHTMFVSALMILAYVLSACSGVPASTGQNANGQQVQTGQVQDVVFTGTVEGVNGNQLTISGQTITVEDGAMAGTVAVGDNIKVEAHVSPDGKVTAVHVEISGLDNANSNSNNGNDNNSNANVNDNTANSNGNQNGNSNSTNGNNNSNDNSNAANQQEVSGMVTAITTESVTINGVVYMIANTTQFKDIIALGDQVKLYVIVNSDGTLTIREIEKSAQTSVDNSNSNSNSNGLDDNSNLNGNSTNNNGDDKGGNSNDSHSNDNGGSSNDNSSGGGSGGNDNGGGGNGNGGG